MHVVQPLMDGRVPEAAHMGHADAVATGMHAAAAHTASTACRATICTCKDPSRAAVETRLSNCHTAPLAPLLLLLVAGLLR